MAQYIPLPDGNSLKLREGESPDQGWERAQKMYPEAFGGRKDEGVKRDTSGFKAAASASASRLQGEAALTAAKIGLMDPAKAEEYYKAKEEEAKARFTPTEAGWSESPFLKFKETLGGSVPYMAAPAAAGIAALAAPVSAPVAAALGAAGAFGTSAAQFTGTNLARQMDTGKSLEETSGAAAFGAAVPQALLDTAAMALMPGIGKLFGSVGAKLTTAEAKAIASQTLGRTVADYAAKTGTAMGREGVTEATQQVLERLQAGLSITDPEARKEYIDSFIGGAALAGAGAPIGRAFERGAAKEQAAKADKEEKAQARAAALAQQEQERAAEEARKNTPEYALQVAQQYSELEQQRADLQSQLRKGTKDAPLSAEDKAFNKQITGQLQQTASALNEIAGEKNRVTQSGLLAQAEAEQKRTTMSPMEYMLDQTQEVPESQFKPVEPDMAGYAMPEPVVPQRRTPSVYADELVRLAQEQQIEPDAATIAQYLASDPQLARQVLEDQSVELPKGVRKELGKTLTIQESLDRLQSAEKRKAATESAAQRLQLLEEEEAEAGAFKMSEAEQLKPGLGGEIMALRRIAANPAVPVKDEGVLSTKVDQLVEVLLQGGPAPAGRVVAGATTEPASKADTLRAQLSYANATDNRERANELKKQLADLNEPETEKGAGDIEFGEAAKEAGIEGRLSVDAMRANRVTRLSGAQLQAYDRLADFVQRVREGNQEVSDARKQTLRNAAERLKETVVGLALNEIDSRRAQANLPEMATADKAKAVGQLNQTLDELIERGAGLFQQPVQQKAQMRGTKIVAGAREDAQQPVGQRVFNNYDAAAKALRNQMREAVDLVGGFVQKEAAPRPERKVQRVEPLLRTQWQSASEREIAQQFAEAKKRAKSDDDVKTLDDIESKFDKLSDTAKDEAVLQVSRVENRLPLEVRGVLKEELADLRTAGVSETGQAELFPGESEKAVTRSTPARFMALLGSKKIAELKAKLAEENRVMEFQAKRAATLEAKAKKEAQEAEAFQQKLLASKAKSPVQKAKDALAKLTGPESKAVQAAELADQIVSQRNAVRTRLRTMIQQIEEAEQKAQKHFDDVKALYDGTVAQLEAVQKQAAEEGGVPRMADLALWTEARDNQVPELKKAQKTLAAVQKSLAAARDTLARVTEEHASDVIDNSIIREGEKAQRKIDAAKAALEKAKADERAAARVVEADKAKKPTAQPSDKEKLEAFARAAGADVIRVYRDTSDPSVQARVTAERKNIARAEEAHEVAQAKGDKEGMELAIKQIEAAYDKVYEILNNAPVRRDTETMASHVEAFDRAQTKALEQTARLFEEQAGIKPLKMAERRTIASVKNVKTGRIETQFKKESVAAQEARVKKEEATGQYPARALEELAKARAERNEVQAQIDYIDNNPAAPRSEAKARQTVARKKAVEKRKALDNKIKQLSAAQKEVVAEAKLEKKAEQQLRQEKQRMVRAAGKLQEEVEKFTDEGLPANPTTSTHTVVELTTAEALKDGRLMDALDYLAQIGHSALIRTHAAKLQPLVMRTKVVMMPDLTVDGVAVPAAYFPETNTIAFRPDNITEEDVIHEVTHAATVQALTMPENELTAEQLSAKKALQAMYATAKEDPAFAQMYAGKNLLEFVSEVQSDAETRAMLDKQPWYKRFFAALMQLVGLGKSTSEKATELIEALYLPAKKYKLPEGVKALPAQAKDAGALTDLADKIVARKKTFGEQVKEIKALELEMSGVDARAALEEVLKRGAAAMGDDTQYKQAMYLVRKRDDLLTQATSVAANGAPELFKDAKGFIGVRTSGKDTGVDVFDAVGKVPAGSPEEKFALASAYLAARRAADKGLEKLDTGALGVTDADMQAALAAANADPELKAALENVARRYKAYNNGLIKFLADTGAVTKALAADLMKGDYIPFYRVRANGVAELVFSDKMVFTVGDIRNQPYLAELKGGEDKIMPLNESLMRNTLLLVDKGLTNLAERNVAYALQDIGKGQGPIDAKTGKPKNLMAIHTGDGPDDASVIRFTQEPDPSNPKDDGKRWLKVESQGTAIEGVPAELVVKSLEGASLPLPGFLKLAGAASDLLRTGVTRTPLYIARQIYKESMAATFTGGLRYGPFRAVLESGKEYGRMMRGKSETQAKLIEKGLMQSQIFSGSPDDLQKIALQLAKGGDQSTINKVFSALDRAAINADAATRALVYDNAIKNGLSEVEAEHMAREYINFSKRGSNAAVQYASRLIPFLNAQIQSLNVLYKAMTGKMPFEEALSIKRKFYNNAMLLFATGLVYAMAMEDDEYFKNARPRDKYTNFFLHLPGVEEPIKIATPFEAGYFFSLAVAAVDGMKRETNNAEQFAALRDLFLQSIPGYSSMGVPQIVKPVFEVWTNKNFFTGAPIESLRLKNMDITQRYTESTTEMAKALSRAVPVLSPIQIEHIVRGYLGVVPLAAAAMANSVIPAAERGERPTTRASELPLIGSAFQRKMGGAQADEVFDLAEAAFQSRTTFNNMLKEGRKDDAKAFREEHKVDLASAIDAGQYRQLVGRLNADIRRTQNRTDLTGDEKRARLDRLEDAKTKAAKDFLTRYRAREERLGG